jgi:sulfur carrier protein ThiS
VRVFVNDTEVTLAEGMTVRHAITALTGGSTDVARLVVKDRWGNSIGLDGALREDDRILIFPKNQ